MDSKKGTPKGGGGRGRAVSTPHSEKKLKQMVLSFGKPKAAPSEKVEKADTPAKPDEATKSGDKGTTENKPSATPTQKKEKPRDKSCEKRKSDSSGAKKTPSTEEKAKKKRAKKEKTPKSKSSDSVNEVSSTCDTPAEKPAKSPPQKPRSLMDKFVHSAPKSPADSVSTSCADVTASSGDVTTPAEQGFDTFVCDLTKDSPAKSAAAPAASEVCDLTEDSQDKPEVSDADDQTKTDTSEGNNQAASAAEASPARTQQDKEAVEDDVAMETEHDDKSGDQNPSTSSESPENTTNGASADDVTADGGAADVTQTPTDSVPETLDISGVEAMDTSAVAMETSTADVDTSSVLEEGDVTKTDVTVIESDEDDGVQTDGDKKADETKDGEGKDGEGKDASSCDKRDAGDKSSTKPDSAGETSTGTGETAGSEKKKKKKLDPKEREERRAEREKAKAERARLREEKRKRHEERKAEKEARDLAKKEEKEKREKERAAKAAEKEGDKLKREEDKKKRDEDKKRKEEEKQKREADKEERVAEKQRQAEKREKEKAEKQKAREEERKRKQEEQQEEREAKKRREEAKKKHEPDDKKKQQAITTMFASFFKKAEPKKECSNLISKQMTSSRGPFIQFQVKANMRLAPPHRVPDRRRGLKYRNADTAVTSQPGCDAESDWLSQVRDGKRGSSLATWPGPGSRDDQEDCTIVDGQVADGEDGKLRRWRRAKFLQFHENYRPAYYGTWRKKSKFIRPRKYDGKDPTLDYEVDSDDEWEEEEPGEDIIHSDGEDDEEKKEAVGSDEEEEDGFLVPHGYLSDDEGADEEEEVDPEKKKLQQTMRARAFELDMQKKTQKLTMLVVGPCWTAGSEPRPRKEGKHRAELRALGPCRTEADLELFSMHGLGLEWPLGVDGDEETLDEAAVRKGEKGRLGAIPEEAMPAFLRMVHGNWYSAARLVDEFREYWRVRCGGTPMKLRPLEPEPQKLDADGKRLPVVRRLAHRRAQRTGIPANKVEVKGEVEVINLDDDEQAEVAKATEPAKPADGAKPAEPAKTAEVLAKTTHTPAKAPEPGKKRTVQDFFNMCKRRKTDSDQPVTADKPKADKESTQTADCGSKDQTPPATADDDVIMIDTEDKETDSDNGAKNDKEVTDKTDSENGAKSDKEVTDKADSENGARTDKPDGATDNKDDGDEAMDVTITEDDVDKDDAEKEDDDVTREDAGRDTEVDMDGITRVYTIKKRRIELKLREVAVFEKRKEYAHSKLWYVREAVLQEYGLEELPVPAQWEWCSLIPRPPKGDPRDGKFSVMKFTVAGYKPPPPPKNPMPPKPGCVPVLTAPGPHQVAPHSLVYVTEQSIRYTLRDRDMDPLVVFYGEPSQRILNIGEPTAEDHAYLHAHKQAIKDSKKKAKPGWYYITYRASDESEEEEEVIQQIDVGGGYKTRSRTATKREEIKQTRTPKRCRISEKKPVLRAESSSEEEEGSGDEGCRPLDVTGNNEDTVEFSEGEEAGAAEVENSDVATEGVVAVENDNVATEGVVAMENSDVTTEGVVAMDDDDAGALRDVTASQGNVLAGQSAVPDVPKQSGVTEDESMETENVAGGIQETV